MAKTLEISAVQPIPGEPFVALTIKGPNGESLGYGMRSPDELDAVIQSLLRHKRHIWPEAP